MVPHRQRRQFRVRHPVHATTVQSPPCATQYRHGPTWLHAPAHAQHPITAPPTTPPPTPLPPPPAPSPTTSSAASPPRHQGPSSVASTRTAAPAPPVSTPSPRTRARTPAAPPPLAHPPRLSGTSRYVTSHPHAHHLGGTTHPPPRPAFQGGTLVSPSRFLSGIGGLGWRRPRGGRAPGGGLGGSLASGRLGRGLGWFRGRRLLGGGGVGQVLGGRGR